MDSLLVDKETKPDIRQGEIKRYRGDAIEVIPTLTDYFDVLLTDPPYPVGGTSSLKSVGSVTDTRLMIDGMFLSFFMSVFRSIKKIDKFQCWIFTDWRQVSFLSNCLRLEGLDKQSVIVWDKGHGSLSALYSPQHELILYASNYSIKTYLGPDIRKYPRPKRSIKTHPFQKPTDLVVDICKPFAGGYKKMIDPFAGSGSLLKAGSQLGWDSIGIDINEIK